MHMPSPVGFTVIMITLPTVLLAGNVLETIVTYLCIIDGIFINYRFCDNRYCSVECRERAIRKAESTYYY